MLSTFWGQEPVLLMAVVQAGIGLALAFGVHLSADQIGAILVFTGAILAVITRGQVTPTSLLPPGTAQAIADKKTASSIPPVAKSIVLLLVLTIPLSSCVKTPPQVLPPSAGTLSPTAANNLDIVLGALQTAAIVLAPVDGIPTRDTNIIVTGVGDAIKIVQAAQTGWLSALDTGFSTIEPQLSPATQATLGPWLNAVYASINALYATGVS